MADATKILTHSGLRARVLEELALEDVKSPSLEQITGKEDELIGRENICLYKDNSRPGYGIEEEIFSAFMGRGQKGFDINYNILGQILRGMKYVESADGRGIPHEILTSMNTAEIAASYRAFAKLIEDGKIETERGYHIKADELRQMPIEKAISEMIGYGLRRSAMGSLRKKGVTYFPTGHGDLARRIKPLSQSVKDRFMALLDLSQYPDGINAPTKKKGATGKRVYISAICYFMDDVYKRNTQKA